MVSVIRDIEDLPGLDEAGEAHLSAVLDALAELINARGGFIGFDEYMRFVLYEPGLGYYSAGTEKFGEQGDYVTAPMISGLFSQTLAGFISRHNPKDSSVLELGAGTGIMAADILHELSELGCLPQTYNILELSADLRERQYQALKQRVPHLLERVHWLDELDPADGFHGIVLGNEVIDALPVKRFMIRDTTVMELGVMIKDGGLCLHEKVAEEQLYEQVVNILPAPLDDFPDGYCSEVNVQLTGWLGYLSDYLHSGIMLFLDYGVDRKAYYQPQRRQGTLRGYYRHHAVDDPFFRPGLADITSWVDFSGLAGAAEKQGLSVCGYATQANFLLDNGLPEIFNSKNLEDDAERLKLSEEVKRLTLPGEMGETVKAMMFSKNCHMFPGFQHDLRYSL